MLALTVAVSKTEPEAAVTFTTSVSTTVFPEFMPTLGTVQVTVPMPPTGGAVQDPLLLATLTKVVPAGIASAMATLKAVSGPLLPLVAVVDQVHTGVNILDSHLGVRRNIRAPLLRVVADEVVALARQFLRAFHSGVGVRVH